MITVAEAEKIILAERRDYGTEVVAIENCIGRVLAEPIHADRDMPPFDRVTMDGIAIAYAAYKKGVWSFKIKATQSAGQRPVEIEHEGECVEIMTGAALPATADTVIPYEGIDIENCIATIKAEKVSYGQNVHLQGSDKKLNDIWVAGERYTTPAIVAVAATVGKTKLVVKKLPRIIVISTGDELVNIEDTPTPYQLRRSNDYMIGGILKGHGVQANVLHLPDNPNVVERELERCLREYDVILMSGGVSMGKFDYVPAVLEKLQVKKLLHKVQQRPGKPFWFGTKDDRLVFAFPGNPVSTFMCVQRYFLPWLKRSLGVETKQHYAVLAKDVAFAPALQYFLQVSLSINESGQVLATPAEGNGSGDFANLLVADAFMELPMEKNEFKKGEVYRTWPFA